MGKLFVSFLCQNLFGKRKVKCEIKMSSAALQPRSYMILTQNLLLNGGLFRFMFLFILLEIARWLAGDFFEFMLQEASVMMASAIKA